MFNCVIDNDCTGTDHHYGCQIMDSASPIITNCKFDGGDASYGYAVICWDSSTPKFQTCTLTGGTGGNSNWGVATHDTTAPIFTNCIISGGSGTSSHGFSSAVNATPILDNCIITVTSSGTGVFVWNSALLKVSGGVITGGGAGISVTDTAIIEITGSIIKGGATGTDFAALNIGSPNLSKVTGCIIIGGTGGAQNYGVQTYYSAAPIITGCTILGGSNGANCYGIYTTYSSSPTISGSTIRSGAKGANSYAVYMKDNSSPNIIGASVYGGVNINGYSHSYTSANNGRFQPYATDAYLITGISVLVNNAAGAGTTLSLGNSIGGTEIASGIAIDSTGLKNFAFTRTEQAAAGYLYATASAGIADGSVTIYYDVTTNYADCWGVYVNTRGYGRIEGTTITSNGASNTVYIVDTAEAANAWKISNCHIETLDATNQKTVACQSAYVGVPIYKSTFIGPFTNVSGLAQDNSGTSSIASGTTSITFAHGLGETPLASWFTITFTENPTNTPGACWVTANATHTIVNVENDPGASNLDFGWKAIKP